MSNRYLQSMCRARWSPALLGLLTAACGARIEGTAAAPAGTTIAVYRFQDAAETQRAIIEHNAEISEALRLAEGDHESLDRAYQLIQRKVNESKAPAAVTDQKDVSPIGRGSVGVDHRIALDGRYRGTITLVIPPSTGDDGCQVTVELPRYGTATVTMAGTQCHSWPEPLDEMVASARISTRWRLDSLQRSSAKRGGTKSAGAWAIPRERDYLPPTR